MSSSILLNRDYPTFSGFLTEAQKVFPGLNLKKVASECNEGSWRLVKAPFINGEKDGFFLSAQAEILVNAFQKAQEQQAPVQLPAPIARARVVEKPRSSLCPILTAAAVAIAAVSYFYAQSL